MAEPIRQSRSVAGAILGGHYRIRSQIGEGGMGAVFKALNTSTDATVAIKVMSTNARAGGPSELGARFQREARTASQLTHPNTIRVYDFGESELGELYLVMEYLEGASLSEVLAECKVMPATRVVRIASQILSSLSEAHRKGIVHRDLKPPNIYLTSHDGVRDFVKVLDFGIAKLHRESGDQLTVSGQVLGTPQYIAPEQWRGGSEPASDLYAVGVLMYRMLTSRVPFQHADVYALMVAHCEDPVPSLPDTVAGARVPKALANFVMKLLAKKPVDRFPTATEALEALEAVDLSDKMPDRAPKRSSAAQMRRAAETGIKRAGRPADEATLLTGVAPLADRQRRPNSRRSLALGAAVMLLGIGLATVFARRAETPPKAQQPIAAKVAPSPIEISPQGGQEEGAALLVAAVTPPEKPAVPRALEVLDAVPAITHRPTVAQQDVAEPSRAERQPLETSGPVRIEAAKPAPPIAVRFSSNVPALVLEGESVLGSTPFTYDTVPQPTARTFRFVSKSAGYAPERRELAITDNTSVEVKLRRLAAPVRQPPERAGRVTTPKVPKEPQQEDVPRRATVVD